MRLYFIPLLLLTFKVYGQAPLDAKFYINNKQVSKAAKDFYNGRFKAIDDTRTFSILDSLRTKNDSTRAFYIYSVSKMLDRADGALADELGNTCKKFVEYHPDYLIDFFYSDTKLVDKKNFIDDWANIIASEFMIDCEGKEIQCIKKSMQIAVAKTKPKNKSKLTQFYSKVKSYGR